jgi:hypothetical protein
MRTSDRATATQPNRRGRSVSLGCAFVCGSNAFVNIAPDAALALGLEARAIKTERYGA